MKHIESRLVSLRTHSGSSFSYGTGSALLLLLRFPASCVASIFLAWLMFPFWLIWLCRQRHVRTRHLNAGLLLHTHKHTLTHTHLLTHTTRPRLLRRASFADCKLRPNAPICMLQKLPLIEYLARWRRRGLTSLPYSAASAFTHLPAHPPARPPTYLAR